VKEELGKKMSPVGLQMIERVFEAITNRNANKRPYTTDIKEFSLRIHRTSRKAYRYVQKVLPDSLPTVTTLRGWMRESLDNRDPLLCTVEAVAAAAAAEAAQNLLQDSSDFEVPVIKEKQEAEEEDIYEGEEEMPQDGEGVQAIIAEEEKVVYYFQNSEEIVTGDAISLEKTAGSNEMLSQSLPVLQAGDQSDSAKVQVVWAAPQGPANYSLSADGMSILINVSEDQNYYKNQESK
jgi:hypothetical protein